MNILITRHTKPLNYHDRLLHIDMTPSEYEEFTGGEITLAMLGLEADCVSDYDANEPCTISRE